MTETAETNATPAEYLILKDGTEVEGHILDSADGQSIFVYLDGMALLTGVMMFSDTNKTETIRAMNHGNEHVYNGYTVLWSASNEYGNCNLVMRKESNA